GRSGPEAAMRACSVLAANHAIEARADCRQDRIWLGKQTAPLAQTPVWCRCAGSSRALLRFRTGVVPKASTSPPMGWSGRAPASTAREAGRGTTTMSKPCPTGSLRNSRPPVLTGFVESQTVAIEYRFAEGRYDRLPSLASDLVRRQVAVITATGNTVSPLAAKGATTAIPIVF